MSARAGWRAGGAAARAAATPSCRSPGTAPSGWWRRRRARIRAEHGHASIFGGSYGWSSAGRYHHAKTQLQRFLGLGGGFTASVTDYSYGAGQTLMPHILGTKEVLLGPVTDWAAIARNAKLMLCFGGLAAEERAGHLGRRRRARLRAADAQAAARPALRFVNISPFRGDTEEVLGAEWVPIRPGTDAAMMLAMAHVLILQAGREDRDFLARCCRRLGAPARLCPGRARMAWRRRRNGPRRITGVPAATIRRAGAARPPASPPC